MSVDVRQRWRFLLVAAAAGYGKTTLLETLAVQHPSAYRTAELLSRQLDQGDRPDVCDAGTGHVIVDDLSRLSASTRRRLLGVLTRLADDVRVTLASRHPLEPGERAALPGPVAERTAADLALPPDPLVSVLRDEHGVTDPDLAGVVYELTAGWPALVHRAGAALAQDGVGPHELLAALTEPGTAGATWLREQVLAEVPRAAVALLEIAVDLDPVPEALCVALADAGLIAVPATDVRRVVHQLTGTGLFVAHPRALGARRGGCLRLVPVLAAVLEQHRRADRSAPHEPRAGAARAEAACDWYAAHGHPLAAATLLHRTNQPHRCAEVIEAHGDEILAAGGAENLVRLVRAVGEPDPSVRLRLLLGDALRMTGDPAGALRIFEPLLAPARAAGSGDAELLWRAAMVHYMRADYHAALETCALGTTPSSTVTDDVLLRSCWAAALAMLGRTEEAKAVAAGALTAASAGGGDRALSAAHVAAALAEVGTRREAHLAEALAAAERGGDVAQMARVLTNQVEGLLRDVRYPEALRVAVRAVRMAELSCPPGLFAAVLCNAGDVYLRLGRFDEAVLCFERVVRTTRIAGLGRAAMGLWGLGEVHRQLGRLEQSRAAFEEAVVLARAANDTQVLAPVLTGLARVLLEEPAADPAAARSAAEEAERIASVVFAPWALVARGRVALAEGNLAMARERAATAVTAARAGRRADGLADALELVAAVSPDTSDVHAALREAEAIWLRAGASPAADRIQVLLGRLPSADGADRLAAKAAVSRLLALGVRTIEGSPLVSVQEPAVPVRICVLGRFEVYVSGRPVPLPAWRSRQARSLVKILVARRGRTVPRLELRELLWPDEEPHRTAHRLSVLLSVIRTVLDPAHRWPADHHVRADLTGISLDLDHVTVDVEELLGNVAHAAALAGDVDRTRAVLANVDRLYRGDAFGDEPYEQWADGLREEARAVWLRAVRDLAELSLAAGDLDQAVAYLVRLLTVDAFDESAHRAMVRALVRAGRHGEARRAFHRWREAMRSIDAPPPDPTVLAVQAPADVGGAGAAAGY
jgi:DNA-binding SARP family transcriptional activator